MIEGCEIGEGVEIRFPELVNLYRGRIGRGTMVGPFVEIQAGVEVGEDCKIESHTFLCGGVKVGDRVFVGHGVMTVNDLYPRVVNAGKFEAIGTVIEDDASIGSGAVLLPVRIGKGALVGAGAVVTHDVGAGEVVYGVPARLNGRGG